MSRQALDQKPFRILKAEIKPGGTGTAKTHRLTTVLVHTGSAGDQILDFVASVGSAEVQASFRIDAEDAWLDIVGKLVKAGIKPPATREGSPRTVAEFVIQASDSRQSRELMMFVHETIRLDALEIEVKFGIVQPDLAFPDGDERNV